MLVLAWGVVGSALDLADTWTFRFFSFVSFHNYKLGVVVSDDIVRYNLR